MKIATFGLAALGLALISTAPAHAQYTRSYTNVDAFGNVTTNTVDAPTSIGQELAQQRINGGTPLGSTTVTVNNGYSNYGYGYPGTGYGGYPTYPNYPDYPPAYGYPFPAVDQYGNPYRYPSQGGLNGPIGIPGYGGPSYTALPGGGTYYGYCPPGYGGYGGFAGYGNYFGLFGGLGGGLSTSYTQNSSGLGLSLGAGGLSAGFNANNNTTNTTQTIVPSRITPSLPMSSARPAPRFISPRPGTTRR